MEKKMPRKMISHDVELTEDMAQTLYTYFQATKKTVSLHWKAMTWAFGLKTIAQIRGSF